MKTAVRGTLWLVGGWVGVAAFCVVGNASLELLAGPTFHRQEYAIAERLASMKVALCRLGSWFFVPGQARELDRALALRADIRDEQSRFPERAK
jgi:hypothetical protein